MFQQCIELSEILHKFSDEIDYISTLDGNCKGHEYLNSIVGYEAMSKERRKDKQCT